MGSPTAEMQPVETIRLPDEAASSKQGLVRPTSYSVVLVRTVEDLQAREPDLIELATAAIEPNVFYEPLMLLPALRHLSSGADLRLLLVYGRVVAGSGEREVLCGFFPLEIARRYTGLGRSLPFRTLKFWRYKYCYLCSPLIRAGTGPDVIREFFDWVEKGDHGCSLVEMNSVPGEGAFHELLVDHFHDTRRGYFVSEAYTRALFIPAGSAESYLEGAMRGARLKELRRKAKRLSEQGRVECTMAVGDDAGGAIEEFIALEAMSWKTEKRAALDSSKPDRRFFEEVAVEAHRLGRLMLLALRVDGVAIAGKCNFLSGSGSFAFKIAYLDEFEKYSPGVLLELENIRLLHGRSEIKWMDSCASRGNAMISRLWPGRRTIRYLVTAARGGWADLIVSAIPLLKWINRVFTRREMLRVRPLETEV